MIVNARPATIDPTDPELIEASLPTSTTVMDITPELAQYWLCRNHNNRSLRGARISALARDMTNGQWAYTGEAIKFSVDGNLIDGQHRLYAILKSGKSIESLVVVGVAEAAQAYMDCGAKRTAADALAFRGEINSTLTAATCRFAVTLQYQRFSGRDSGVSHAEIMTWMNEHPEIRKNIANVARHASKIDIKPSVMAYALWKMTALAPSEAAYFFTDIVEMRTEGPGDPIYALLSRLRTARQNRERLTPLIELSFITRAWNARRQNIPLKILKVPFNELEVLELR
jgi:hypothetical protein